MVQRTRIQQVRQAQKKEYKTTATTGLRPVRKKKRRVKKKNPNQSVNKDSVVGSAKRKSISDANSDKQKRVKRSTKQKSASNANKDSVVGSAKRNSISDANSDKEKRVKRSTKEKSVSDMNCEEQKLLEASTKPNSVSDTVNSDKEKRVKRSTKEKSVSDMNCDEQKLGSFDLQILKVFMKHEWVSTIDEIFTHPTLKIRRSTRNVSDFLLPFGHNFWIDNMDYQIVANDDFAGSTTQLYANSQILDLATAWTFIDPDSDWLSLPANFYYHVKSEMFSESCGAMRYLNTTLQSKSFSEYRSLFDFKVIDGFICEGSHWTQFFIFNLGNAVNSSQSVEVNSDKKNEAFILYANSLTDVEDQDHEKIYVGSILRYFLNKYASSELKRKKSDLFDEKTLPVFSLNVPMQNNAWSCGFECLLNRYAVMVQVSKMTSVTLQHMQNFRTENLRSTNDVLSLRSDLSTLLRCLSHLNEKFASVEYNVVEDESMLNKEVSLTGRYLRLSDYASKHPKGPRWYNLPEIDKFDVHAAEFLQSLSSDEALGSRRRKKRLSSLAQKGPRRPGDPAHCFESYHDDPYRYCLYHVGDHSLKYQRMCEYKSENSKHLPKCTYIGIMMNHISAYPDSKGEDFCPIRETPLRLIVSSACDRDALMKVVTDVYCNFRHYEIVSSVEELDGAVMGHDRVPSLDDFVSKKKKK